MSLLRHSFLRESCKYVRTDRRGFTLTEMLVTLLILTLASTLMATGIPAAIDTYQKVVKTSNAQLALSTTLSILRSELGLATKVEIKGDEENAKIYYYSSGEGCWAWIGNDSSETASHRGLVKQYLKGMPTPTTPVEALVADGPSAPLVSNEAVTDTLKVSLKDASKVDAQDVVGVKIDVVDRAGNKLASVGDDSDYRILTRFAN